jgi:hypothetical protein
MNFPAAAVSAFGSPAAKLLKISVHLGIAGFDFSIESEESG